MSKYLWVSWCNGDYRIGAGLAGAVVTTRSWVSWCSGDYQELG